MHPLYSLTAVHHNKLLLGQDPLVVLPHSQALALPPAPKKTKFDDGIYDKAKRTMYLQHICLVYLYSVYSMYSNYMHRSLIQH